MKSRRVHTLPDTCRHGRPCATRARSIRVVEKEPDGAAPLISQMWRHWRVLCERIGDRRAGGGGEQAAAGYLQDQFAGLGLQEVHAESFPCISVLSSQAEIRVKTGRTVQSLPCRVLAGSPPTPRGQTISGPIAWIEMPEQADRMFTRRLRDKVVVLVGPMPDQAELHRRLVACRPAAVIHADDRLPFEWVKDDGVYPSWVRRYGMPPTVAAPFRLVWQLRQRSADRASVRIRVRQRASTSQNVVAEIGGSRPSLPLILLAAHHDTQCHSVGADDNASGVVALLELARLLAETRPARTIRFVSFGAEEQLSVGSAWYVTQHRSQLGSIGLVLNLDSVASVLGHHWLIRSGPAVFGAWLGKAFSRWGLDTVDRPAPMPFADHFPFSVYGVPAATLYRPNMDGGMRWQHHSEHDALGNVSVPELCRVVHACCGVVGDLARQTRWPFGRGLEPAHRSETLRLARDLFDLDL